MVREIIKIEEEKCDGCGNCVPGCPEGALQIIDGKARLVSDLHCDGLGACIGECPTGALTIERREAEAYDEKTTMQNIMRAGANTVRAHLKHLLDHGEKDFFRQACEALEEAGLDPEEYVPAPQPALQRAAAASGGGCPGSKMMDLRKSPTTGGTSGSTTGGTSGVSHLQQWPVQMHLISPRAPYFQNADLLLAADCVAYAVGDFHSRYLEGKSLAVACPKLDTGQEVYVQKLVALIDEAKLNTITVVLMQVPCCGGLLQLAQTAAAQATRKIPIKAVVVDVQGRELQSDWV